MENQIEKQDVPENEKDFEVQSGELDAEKKKIQEEFNIQRAKLKDLYLQKEAELARKTQENNELLEQVSQLKNQLDDCKSQLYVDSITLESSLKEEKRKAQEEIASLQRIVHETVEESSSTKTLYDSELIKLESYVQQLQKEIIELKKEKNHQSPHHISQDHSSLAPSQVLNVLTKSLKKLGADSFSSQDSVEDSFKKTEEDAEVLRSLVEPLEDQIKALKEKLRTTDEQLQRCKQCGHQQEDVKAQGDERPSLHDHQRATTATNTSAEASMCDMCSNYEAELVKEQKKTSELQAAVAAAEKAAERHREELLKEIGFRKEMEEKWNEKKEEHKQQVAALTKATECTEQDLKELRHLFNQACSEMKQNLGRLTHDRETIHQELNKLQKDNDNLVGKYTIHSQELQSQIIDLPDTVEELHELILRNHQDLIIAKMGKEAAEENVNMLQSEIMVLKDRITNEQHERKGIEESLDQEIRSLRKQIDQLDREKKHITSNQEQLVATESLTQEKMKEYRDKIDELTALIKTLEKRNSELKTRVSSLQQELDTSETVQKDFVQLSQSLQVQLEKIRGSDTEVRWQHEEDVNECPACRCSLSAPNRKQHCRHCGQVFCRSCVTRTVPSGPRSRPAKVCDVCHTLLVKSSAPYFSEAPPMT